MAELGKRDDSLARARLAADLCKRSHTFAVHRARNEARLLVAAARGGVPGCTIAEPARLAALAAACGLQHAPKSGVGEVTALCEALLGLLDAQASPFCASRAPEGRRKIWQRNGILSPAGSLEIENCSDPAALLAESLRLAVCDGWGASMLAIDLEDAIFGTPAPARCELQEDGRSYPAIAGFGPDAIRRMLGGRFRASFEPLIASIVSGRLRGVAVVVGHRPDSAGIAPLAAALLKSNVLVLAIGGPAVACAKAGLLLPEAAAEAGPGLREVCEAVGCPPVLDVGSLAESSRILSIAAGVAQEAGMSDLADLPLAAICLQSAGSTEFAVGQCLVASGISVIAIEADCQIAGEAEIGASWLDARTLDAIPEIAISLIESKRDAAGLNRQSVAKS